MAVEDLMDLDAHVELARLADEIRKHDEAYFLRDEPIISDAAMRSDSKQGHRGTFPGLKRADSPTNRVGAPALTKFAKVAHEKPMLSLKIFSPARTSPIFSIASAVS